MFLLLFSPRGVNYISHLCLMISLQKYNAIIMYSYNNICQFFVSIPYCFKLKFNLSWTFLNLSQILVYQWISTRVYQLWISGIQSLKICYKLYFSWVKHNIQDYVVWKQSWYLSVTLVNIFSFPFICHRKMGIIIFVIKLLRRLFL